jgi:hypothetical protein
MVNMIGLRYRKFIRDVPSPKIGPRPGEDRMTGIACDQTTFCLRRYATTGCGALATLAFAIAPAQVRAHDYLKNFYTFHDIINTNDVTFNQELGINNAGVIAGYFGSGAQGHPNKGYTVVPRGAGQPVVQSDFVNENFPRSVQTQVTGLNNLGNYLINGVPAFLGTTVGFWSNQNQQERR